MKALKFAKIDNLLPAEVLLQNIESHVHVALLGDRDGRDSVGLGDGLQSCLGNLRGDFR